MGPKTIKSPEPVAKETQEPLKSYLNVRKEMTGPQFLSTC